MGSTILPGYRRRGFDRSVLGPLLPGLFDTDAPRPDNIPGHCRRLRLPNGIKIHLQAGELVWKPGETLRASNH